MKNKTIVPAASRLAGGLLTLLLAAMLMATSARAYSSEEQAMREANFKGADANGDGSLTESEFRASIDANADDDLGRAAKVRRFGAYGKAFKKLDQDASGTVSWSEVVAMQ